MKSNHKFRNNTEEWSGGVTDFHILNRSTVRLNQMESPQLSKSHLLVVFQGNIKEKKKHDSDAAYIYIYF